MQASSAGTGVRRERLSGPGYSRESCRKVSRRSGEGEVAQFPRLNSKLHNHSSQHRRRLKPSEAHPFLLAAHG